MLLALLTAIVLEALPYDIKLVFASSPTETINQFFSFFSFVPFGYGNFSPLLVAILTIFITLAATVSFALSLVQYRHRILQKALLICTVIAFLLSLFPLFRVTLTNAFVSFCLLFVLVVQIVANRSRKDDATRTGI